MNLALWITAGLLAVVALSGGISKTFVPKEKLAAFHGGGWTADAGVGFVKILGVLELLAACGLVLPAALDVAPVLVPVTATCWILLMVGAMITHGRGSRGAQVNGQPGAIIRDRDGKVLHTLALDVVDGRIQTIRLVINPGKLGHVGPVADAWSIDGELRRTRRSGGCARRAGPRRPGR